jgi:hypothetical protein
MMNKLQYSFELHRVILFCKNIKDTYKLKVKFNKKKLKLSMAHLGFRRLNENMKRNGCDQYGHVPLLIKYYKNWFLIKIRLFFSTSF